MIEYGTTVKSRDIGRKGTSHYVYYPCPVCGVARWIQNTQVERTKGRCKTCAGASRRGQPNLKLRGAVNPSWRGGRTLLKTGYIRTRLMPEDPLCAMAITNGRDGRSGYVLEHRLVMARHLGRPLASWEVVHHINGDKTDNHVENLELLPNRQSHMAFTLLQEDNRALRERIQVLESRVTVLEAERVIQGR